MASVSAQFDAACFCGSKSRFGAFTDPASFILGDGREDVQGQPIGLWVVTSDEINPAVHEFRNEGHIAGETVQFRNHEGGAGLPT